MKTPIAKVSVKTTRSVRLELTGEQILAALRGELRLDGVEIPKTARIYFESRSDAYVPTDIDADCPVIVEWSETTSS